MKLPTFIKCTSPLSSSGLLGTVIQLFNRTSSKQIVESLIRHGSVVVDSLLIVSSIVGFCICSMFCCALLYVYSSFAKESWLFA